MNYLDSLVETSFIFRSSSSPFLFETNFLFFLGLLLNYDVLRTEDNPLKTGAYLIFFIYYSERPTFVFDFLGLGVMFLFGKFLSLLFLRLEFSLSEFLLSLDEISFSIYLAWLLDSCSSIREQFSLCYSETFTKEMLLVFATD